MTIIEPIKNGASDNRFRRLLEQGHFVVTAELSPPDSADPAEVERRLNAFEGFVDAVNATDGSGANCHMSSIAVSALIRRLGYTPIMQISCRDTNRIGIQGNVLGAAALGIQNILCLTGDGVQAGDHPGSRPVFDLDSISLINTIRLMRDKGTFLSGRPIEPPPDVFIGGALNPFAPPREYRSLRMLKKIHAGANFFQTQYCFDIDALKSFLDEVAELAAAARAPILVGVGPLASARAAKWMREHVPGVSIPDHLIRRMEGAKNQRAEGQRICVEIMQQAKELTGVRGIHLMAYRQEEFVADIVKASGVLGNRLPWSRADEREKHYNCQASG